ncbi:MAG: MFS transporter [Planctomycetaceae bacterium]|nr:MFS transporter [Planctomycetaceae bacterium]
MLRSEQTDGPRGTFLDQIGIFPPLLWGYVGLLLFMIGDGVEAGYLSKYLVDQGIASKEAVAIVFTAYGVTVAISAWLSGALSDLWGPWKVMRLGMSIWVLFHAGFLLLGIAPGNYVMVVAMYALRGFGYPLFAYGFLVWISVATPQRRLGTAVGWFWFALTGGLMTLGPLFASVMIPRIGPYHTLWCSLALVIAGGLVGLVGIREPVGKKRLAPEGEHPLLTLLSSVSIAWRKPKTAIGCVVRIINTAPQNGFIVFLPIYFTETIGFKLEQWLHLLSFMFMSNIIWNLLFGFIGDRLGWQRTVAWCGGVGSAITTLLLYYSPNQLGTKVTTFLLDCLPENLSAYLLDHFRTEIETNYPLAIVAAVLYGATLAGYVPLSALMPSLAPQNKGAAMSLLNLGAGASNWVGPAIVALFLPVVGVGGVMWIYAVLYLISAVMTLFLTLPSEDEAPSDVLAGGPDSVEPASTTAS